MPILVDLAFDNQDVIIINAAIAQWNYALNGWLHLHIVGYVFVDDAELTKYHSGWLFVKALSTDKLTIMHDKEQKPGYHALGFVNDIGGNQLFIIRERLDNEQVLGILLHEIGHLLGAQHDEAGLMVQYYNEIDYQCIDENTIKEIAVHEKLPVATLNYCTLD